jgi:hypothetical protein
VFFPEGQIRGREIFRVLYAVSESPDVLVCRLVNGNITFVHRRLWPALARVAHPFEPRQVTVLANECGRLLSGYPGSNIVKWKKRLSESPHFLVAGVAETNATREFPRPSFIDPLTLRKLEASHVSSYTSLRLI